MTRIAIQGASGSFSHAAAIKALGSDVEIMECRTSEALLDAVSDGIALYGVVPVENTLAGSVQRNMDLLFQPEIHIVAEARIRIRMCLAVRPGYSMSQVRRVASHPVALQQCQGFFSRNPLVEAVTAFDTAGSVRDLMAGDADYDAAIGSELAASLYGADVLEQNLEDHEQNFTRFLTIARNPIALPEQGVKTSIAFTVQHRPGALHEALLAIAAHDVDLTRIESRPIAGQPWKYRLYADLRALSTTDQSAAVEALEAVTSEVRLLGQYLEEPEGI